ncbi:MAG TPA: LPS-assembly protein LptD [Desulfuromonadales bacterium]|nr:LPS-assembly protein LptD [Desulfuromonadales bacterium]
MKFINYLLIFFVIACRAAVCSADEPALSDGNVHINADTMSQDQNAEVYTAEGHVVARWQGQTLAADRIRYEATTHMLYANGSVILSKDAAVLTGEALVMNIDTGRAEIGPGLLKAPLSGTSVIPGKPDSGITIMAEKLIRLNETEYSGTSAEITSCDLPDPFWKFSSSTMSAKLNGYATGRNVIFYVKDMPVLYLPWMAFPVLDGKTSGLLRPNLSKSQKQGVKLDIPLYLVISPSQDLQLDIYLMSLRGVGTSLNYRYIRTRGSEGHINTYQIYDKMEDRWRWSLSQEHKEIFSPDANLRLNVNLTSDSTFLSDYGEKVGDYNRQSSDTTINTLNIWHNYALTSYLRYSDNLYTNDNKATLQALPSLGGATVRQRLFSAPLYVDFDGTMENLYRETAPRGQRLHLFPRITIYPYKSDVLQTQLYTGLHVRGYVTDNRDSSKIRTSDTDLLPEAGGRISTSLTRVYDAGYSTLQKVRHEIIPELRYNFIPEHDQQRLPYYDYTDRMITQNAGGFSITNVISGKFVSGESTEYRDISRVALGADYLFSGERRDLLTPVYSQRPWSDLIVETDTWLSTLVRFTFDCRYNLYNKYLSTTAAGIDVDDRQGNSLGAGYQMARSTPSPLSGPVPALPRDGVEYIEGRFATKLVTPLKLSYSIRYSLDSHDFLESLSSVEYRHKCWSVDLSVHQRPGNNSFSIHFNLAGL